MPIPAVARRRAVAAGGPSFALTVADPLINGLGNENNNFNVTSNLYVDRDGGIRRRYENYGSFTTVNAGTYSNGDESDSAFGDDYHVRVTYLSGANNYSSGAGLSTWLALTSDRLWTFVEQRSGPDSGTSTWTVAFSDDGGSTTLDSFVFEDRRSWDSP
jgi:hypothetical protein